MKCCRVGSGSLAMIWVQAVKTDSDPVKLVP